MLPAAFFEHVISHNRTDGSADDESYNRSSYNRATLGFGRALTERPHAKMIADFIVFFSSFLHDFGMELRSKNRVLSIPHRTGIVGVINVTPDSFVAGSRAQTENEVLALARECMDGGADILEIGGESTGPASTDVSVADELARVLPAVTIVREKIPDAWIAVDTCKSEVACTVLAAGADMINDVTAGRGDPAMFDVIAQAACPMVLMYAKDPSARTTIANVPYDDVIRTVREFLASRIAAANKAGVTQIIFDPGLGHFVSADPACSWEILFRLNELASLGPILVSPSRKSFLAGPSALPASERLAATITANCLASVNGASFIRTHDVRRTREALDATTGIVHPNTDATKKTTA